MRTFAIILLTLLLTVTLLFGALTWGIYALTSEQFIGRFVREIEFTGLATILLEQEDMDGEETDAAWFLAMLEEVDADTYIADSLEAGLISTLRYVKGDADQLEFSLETGPIRQAIISRFSDYEFFVQLLEEDEPELAAELENMPDDVREEIHEQFLADAALSLEEALPESVNFADSLLGEDGTEALAMLRTSYSLLQSLVYVPLGLALVLILLLILIGRFRGMWAIGSAALIAGLGVFFLWALFRVSLGTAAANLEQNIPGMAQIMSAPILMINIWRDIGFLLLGANLLSFAVAIFWGKRAAS